MRVLARTTLAWLLVAAACLTAWPVQAQDDSRPGSQAGSSGQQLHPGEEELARGGPGGGGSGGHGGFGGQPATGGHGGFVGHAGTDGHGPAFFRPVGPGVREHDSAPRGFEPRRFDRHAVPRREFGIHERREHELFFLGPGFIEWGPSESYDDYMSRLRANCDQVWQNCALSCDGIDDPAQREDCFAKCNNSGYECYNVPY